MSDWMPEPAEDQESSVEEELESLSLPEAEEDDLLLADDDELQD